MDDCKIWFFTILMVLMFSRSYAHAEALEYISPEKQVELAKTFDSAEFDQKKITSSVWNCDMYGVRSHLQVKHDLKLYKWEAPAEAKPLHNSGAQLISEYKSNSNSLSGQTDRFEDEVKITKDGQLVSRLRMNNPSKTVIAYSICKSL